MYNFLNTTTKNVLWFKQAHDKHELDMKPPFQRNPVWVTRQKSFLIDSILNGYPIPEIYMQETVSADGQSKHIVVDGQQRLRAVLEFLENRFSIDGKDSPSWADMYFDDLSDNDKKTIYGYNFVIRILPEMDDTQIRAIFQRLNRNVLALNKQELRQATYWGSFITTMNDLSDKEIWRKIGIFTQNDIRRMLDVEFISELTIAMLNGPQNKKTKLEDYYKLYEESFDEKGMVEDTFSLVLSEIVKTLPEISKTRWSKKTDFYTLFLLLAEYKNLLPLTKRDKLKLSEKLIEFSELANQFIKAKGEGVDQLPPAVKKYCSGIRASTDLGSRKNRTAGLKDFFAELLDGIEKGEQ